MVGCLQFFEPFRPDSSRRSEWCSRCRWFDPRRRNLLFLSSSRLWCAIVLLIMSSEDPKQLINISVCDTVLNFEIVLSSGVAVNANATSNPSLFKALKGGTNNLGLVTRIDLPTIPESTVLAGNVVAESISLINAYLKAFADIANATSYDEYASLVTGLTFNSTSKEWSLVTTAAYTKPGASSTTTPAVYQELFSIPSAANTVAVVNISTLAAEAPIPALYVHCNLLHPQRSPPETHLYPC